MKKIGFILCYLLSLTGLAQQDAQFTQYMFNSIYYNPSVVGTEGKTQFSTLFRSQWLGYTPTYSDGGAPITQILSFNSPVNGIHGGVGAYLVNDRLGPLTNFQAQAAYSYHAKIKNSILSIGVQGGVYMQNMNFDIYRANDPADPLLTMKTGQETQIKPDISAGIQYRNQKYTAGLGVSHINTASFDFGVKAKNKLVPHYYVTGSYNYAISFEVMLKFYTLIKLSLNQTIFDLGALAYFKDYLWGGLSFRQSEAVILLLGYSFLKSKALIFGYSLDYVIQDRRAKQATSHEIMLQYNLPVKMAKKKVIRTPRFRY